MGVHLCIAKQIRPSHFPQLLLKVIRIDHTALSNYSQGIQDDWLACPSLYVLAKSTTNLGHPIFHGQS